MHIHAYTLHIVFISRGHFLSSVDLDPHHVLTARRTSRTRVDANPRRDADSDAWVDRNESRRGWSETVTSVWTPLLTLRVASVGHRGRWVFTCFHHGAMVLSFGGTVGDEQLSV